MAKHDWEEEDGSIDGFLMLAFRRMNLEALAREQNTSLYCPLCERYFDKEPEQLSLFNRNLY